MDHDEVERDIQDRLVRGDPAGAATSIVRNYGPEIFGFLVALHPNDDASEVFSIACEHLWTGLSCFRGGSTFRTWAYAVTRNASRNYRRDARRRDKRFAPLPEGSALAAAAVEVRTLTLSYLRTERKDAFAALRESLEPDDQALLVLRVDRGLAWNDLALVLHDGETALGADDLKREASRLRKRFQALKRRLFVLGQHAGLVGCDKDGREP